MLQSISELLPPGHPWRQRLLWLESVDSTNTYAKALAQQGASEGTIVFANGQTGGRGRLGRSFASPFGTGLYASLILRPDCPPQQLMHLTCAAGLAASDAVKSACGVEPGIKWTNDLVLERRKLGGILTEMSVDAATGCVTWAIVGIGINCNQTLSDFPPEIREIATSLSIHTSKAVDRAALAAALVSALYEMRVDLFCRKADILSSFSNRCVTIGKPISILRGEDILHALATGVDSDGGLIVRYDDGSVGTVTSGEVSIRGMYGYV